MIFKRIGLNMKTERQRNIKKKWSNPKIEKWDIYTSTKARKKGTGPETPKRNGKGCRNDGSYCP